MSATQEDWKGYKVHGMNAKTLKIVLEVGRVTM